MSARLLKTVYNDIASSTSSELGHVSLQRALGRPAPLEPFVIGQLALACVRVVGVNHKQRVMLPEGTMSVRVICVRVSIRRRRRSARKSYSQVSWFAAAAPAAAIPV